MENEKAEETVKTPLKKSFDTYWSESLVELQDRLTHGQMYFFKHHYRGPKTVVWKMLHPDSIGYKDLSPFMGKKTRITIEVIE